MAPCVAGRLRGITSLDTSFSNKEGHRCNGHSRAANVGHSVVSTAPVQVMLAIAQRPLFGPAASMSTANWDSRTPTLGTIKNP